MRLLRLVPSLTSPQAPSVVAVVHVDGTWIGISGSKFLRIKWCRIGSRLRSVHYGWSRFGMWRTRRHGLTLWRRVAGRLYITLLLWYISYEFRGSFPPSTVSPRPSTSSRKDILRRQVMHRKPLRPRPLLPSHVRRDHPRHRFRAARINSASPTVRETSRNVPSKSTGHTVPRVPRGDILSRILALHVCVRVDDGPHERLVRLRVAHDPRLHNPLAPPT